jgi:hypothetical protein
MNGLMYMVLIFSMSSLLAQSHTIIHSLEHSLQNRRFEHYSAEALKKSLCKRSLSKNMVCHRWIMVRTYQRWQSLCLNDNLGRHRLWMLRTQCQFGWFNIKWKLPALVFIQAGSIG